MATRIDPIPFYTARTRGPQNEPRCDPDEWKGKFKENYDTADENRNVVGDQYE